MVLNCSTFRITDFTVIYGRNHINLKAKSWVRVIKISLVSSLLHWTSFHHFVTGEGEKAL